MSHGGVSPALYFSSRDLIYGPKPDGSISNAFLCWGALA